MIQNPLVFIMIFGLSCIGARWVSPALAAGFDTPQYSGQTPQFDRGFDTYRDGNARRAAEQRLQAVQRDRQNDLAVNSAVQRRTVQIQSEMVRKREESLHAAEQQRLMHLND